MALWLWYFWFYSFLGWLAERLFARLTRSPSQRRRCLLLLPLCPVYGLGMAAVLALPEPLRQGLPLILSGMAVATGAEYLYHWACQRWLGVRFWDYSRLPGNLHGRVCLPFSLAWGGLVWLAAGVIHPAAAALLARIPPSVTFFFLLLFTADAVCSVYFLHRTHDVAALRRALF